MGSTLDSILVNIIMTELKKTIVKDLFDKYLIREYMQYADDILILVKKKDIKLIHDCFNSFDVKYQIYNRKFPRW